MPVANDLQNMVADVSAAIAGRETYGRTELERLRRQLAAAARELGHDERNAGVAGLRLRELVDGVEAGVANLAGLAARARTHLAAPNADPIGEAA